MGARTSLWRGFGVAAAGLPLLIQPNLATVLIGLALVGIGTFLTQATATGFVSRAATGDRGSASGAAVVPNGLDKIDDVGEILADIAPEFSVRAIYSPADMARLLCRSAVSLSGGHQHALPLRFRRVHEEPGAYA